VDHVLPDGTRLVIRPIRPDDKRLLARAVAELSDESARRRFLAPKRSLSPRELRYLTVIDGRDHLALVAVRADDPAVLVAVARCVRSPHDPQTAEMAILVADPWQRLGLGRRLAELLAEAARAVGVRRFTATLLGENVAAHRMLRTIAPRLEDHGVRDGVRDVVLDLAA
jgi:GNAT superfamily N-acetyltransferase